MARIILHADVNSAFLSWESVKRLSENKDAEDLRLIPSAVGGDVKTRTGIILAKSVPAKKYGIVTGEPIVKALKKCPQLVLCKSDFRTYNKYSAEFIRILKEYAPVVEQFSIDEAFMDMTGTELIYPDIVKTANEIRSRIKDELGFTINVGISENKLLAKMASDFEKPDKVHTLFKSEIAEKMWPMPVRELFSVGKSTVEKLQRLGISTIGALAKADIALLRLHFGNRQAEGLINYANGRDDSPVESEEAASKSYGNSITLPYDVDTMEEAEKVILALCDNVAARLRADGVKTETVTVTIKDYSFKVHSHQEKLDAETDVTDFIFKKAVKLFNEMWDKMTPIRLLGVSAGNISDDEFKQLSFLDDVKNDRLRAVDKAVDSIRKKYGREAVLRASLMNDASVRRVGKKEEGER